ncbi:MAG TPA: hypothetical protein PKH77_09705 [Anaerolineae bacterium]|nr:hypothetical protein [Anaerolineae bacterium]
MPRGRRPRTERPVVIRVRLRLYPSRHQAILDYLQGDTVESLPAKVIRAVHAALTGGVLSPPQTVTADEVATMLADMEGLFS